MPDAWRPKTAGRKKATHKRSNRNWGSIPGLGKPAAANLEMERKLRDAIAKFGVQFDQTQRELIEVGLCATSRKVNEAVQMLGWEADRLLTKLRKKNR